MGISQNQILKGFNDLLHQHLAYYVTETPPVVTPPVTPPAPPPVVTPPPPPEPPVVTPPPPEPIPEPPQIDDSINTNMVTQQVINFNIVNGRAVGSIKFVATNNFNPYYFNKPIVNIIEFKDPNGANILTYVKQNTLNFTETERDEVINYDEDMKGNTRATVESFVWSSATQPTAFSNKYTIDIQKRNHLNQSQPALWAQA